MEMGEEYPVEIIKEADSWKTVICEAVRNGKLYAEKTDIVVIADDKKVIKELQEVLNASKIDYKLLTGSELQDNTVANIIFALDE